MSELCEHEIIKIECELCGARFNDKINLDLQPKCNKLEELFKIQNDLNNTIQNIINSNSILKEKLKIAKEALDGIFKRTMYLQLHCEELCSDKSQEVGCRKCINNIAQEALRKIGEIK